MTYRVMVDDNFHYQDEGERYTRGEYDSLDEAIAACKKIVDDFLDSAYKPDMTAEALYAQYTSFGEDPWIRGEEKAPFSSRAYAKQRCSELCSAQPPARGQP